MVDVERGDRKVRQAGNKCELADVSKAEMHFNAEGVAGTQKDGGVRVLVVVEVGGGESGCEETAGEVRVRAGARCRVAQAILRAESCRQEDDEEANSDQRAQVEHTSESRRLLFMKFCGDCTSGLKSQCTCFRFAMMLPVGNHLWLPQTAADAGICRLVQH